MQSLSPLRSVLFVPAANPRALAKSEGVAADALIFDLEDSAAPEEKDAARRNLEAHLAAARFSGRRIVRINPLGDEAGAADLACACRGGADAILLPKVEGPDDLFALDAALERQGAPAGLALWAMIETPRGLLAAAAMAAARPRRPLQALVAGPNDLVATLDLRLSPGRPALAPYLAAIVLAAKAEGLAVLDGVFNDFSDAAGFAAECLDGRARGFDGKTLIHPSQIAQANAAFAPSQEELAAARAIVEAFARPENVGRGVVPLEGRMVERLHLAGARRLLAFAACIEKGTRR